MDCLSPSDLMNFIQIVGFSVQFISDSLIELTTNYNTFFWERQMDGSWCVIKGAAL